MQSQLNPYLTFRDTTRQAMEFYQGIFGGTLESSTFKEYPGVSEDPGEGEKIMHSVLKTENGMTLMASDTPNRMEHAQGRDFSLSLSGDDEAELRGYFEKLAADGTVTMPLEKAPWGDTFGMVKDRFGISWLVNISPAS
jgi:PhnB protein